MKKLDIKRVLSFSIFLVCLSTGCRAQTPADTTGLDSRVKGFLETNRGTWRDMNVPQADGRALHDIIIENGYTRALEVGTSTGYSGIWIASALAKNGGKLITIDIDEGRLSTARENFEEAGLAPYIDARLADAHELVKELDGPFDFVFVDADKNWYPQYFRDIYPKLVVDGCFTAHNVSMRQRGMREFITLLEETPNLETEIVMASRSGLSVSYKRAN